MGWLFKQITKDDLVKELTTSTETATCLDYSLRGNVLYSVWEFKETGKRLIGIDTIDYDRRDNTYGYKNMSEAWHPYNYDCPLKFLKLVPEVANQEWRDKVISLHTAKKEALNKPKVKYVSGDIVKLKNTTLKSVKLIECIKGKTWKAYDIKGKVWKVPPRFFTEELLKELI